MQSIIRPSCQKFLRFFDHRKIIENTPTQEGTKRIEMMVNSAIRNIENYEATKKIIEKFYSGRRTFKIRTRIRTIQH